LIFNEIMDKNKLGSFLFTHPVIARTSKALMFADKLNKVMQKIRNLSTTSQKGVNILDG